MTNDTDLGGAMNLKRMTSVVMVASLIVASLPATAYAAGNENSATTTAAVSLPTLLSGIDLRGATARALASSSVGQVTTPAPAPGKPQKSNRRNAASGGGGGGATGTIMMVVGIAASLGATYFVIKEMNKTTEQLTATPHVAR